MNIPVFVVSIFVRLAGRSSEIAMIIAIIAITIPEAIILYEPDFTVLFISSTSFFPLTAP